MPKIFKIRLGCLDHEDLDRSKSFNSGQQASLDKEVEQRKLLELYTVK